MKQNIYNFNYILTNILSDYKMIEILNYKNIICPLLGHNYNKYTQDNKNEFSDENLLEYLKENDIKNTDKIFLLLIMSGFKECTKFLIFNKNIRMNELYFQAYVNAIYDTEYDDKITNDYEKIFHEFEFKSEHLKLAIISKNIPIIKYIIYNKKIKLNEECYDKFIELDIEETYDEYNKIFKDFIFNKCHLEKAINKKNINITKYLIENNKTKLGDDLFKMILEAFLSNDNNVNFIISLFINNETNFDYSYLKSLVETKNKKIIEFIIKQKKIVPTNDIIELFMKYNFIDNDSIISLINDINIQNELFNSFHLKLAIDTKNIKFIKKIIEERKIVINDDCIDQIIDRYDHKIKENEILEILKLIDSDNKNIFNDIHLGFAIQRNRLEIVKYFIETHKIKINKICMMQYYNQFYLYNKDFCDLYKFKDGYNKLYELFLNNINFDYDQECLIAACESLFLKGIQDILNSNKFNPNFDKCINVILNKCHKSAKFRYDDNINQILLLFAKFGYVLEEKYIIEFLNKGLELNKIFYEKFKPTAEFYDSCKYPEMCSVACKDVYYLRKICKEPVSSKLLLIIKNFIEKYKIIPDYQCFCNSFNCNKKWELLMEYIDDTQNIKEQKVKEKEKVIKEPKEKVKEKVIKEPKEKVKEKVIKEPKEKVKEKVIEKPKEKVIEKPKEKVIKEPKEKVIKEKKIVIKERNPYD
jgi:hypothetical protein